MRTTITFDDDTAAAVDQLRRHRGVGVSAAVNELVRRAVAQPERVPAFVQGTSAGHTRIDLADVFARDPRARPGRGTVSG